MEAVDLRFQWSVRALTPDCSLVDAFYSICSQMGLDIGADPSMNWLNGVFQSFDLMKYTVDEEQDLLVDQVWASPVLPPRTTKVDDMYYTSRRTYTIRLRINQPCLLSEVELAICLKDILVSHLSTIVYRPFGTARAQIVLHGITVHEVLPEEGQQVKRRKLPTDTAEAYAGFFSQPVVTREA